MSDAYPQLRRPRRRRIRSHLAVLPILAVPAAIALYRVAAPLPPHPAAPVRVEPARVEAPAQPAAPAAVYAWMLDPTPVLGAGAPTLIRPAPRPPVAVAAVPAVQPVAALAAPPAASAPNQIARVAQAVPLPVPRPAELRVRPETLRLARRPSQPSARLAGRQDAEAERSFFETVFGAKSTETKPAAEAPTALAYAGTPDEAMTSPTRRSLGPVAPSGGVAIYDITARTVTLPSGERLEAHSGLGIAQDSPRHVHVKMRGATPPGTYDLTEREALFHGVRAIRLNPVGGSGAVHGRVGLLAHTYMLGPSGASNGCVVFRQYDRFLQAYLRGEVRRLVVVAGNGQDGLPSFAERMFRSGG
ncbi:DUF2778 domain-containing protein [Methylobacterium sp. A54F]